MNWYQKVLKNYAVFTGRARRKEYWFFFLFNCIFGFVYGFIVGFMFAMSGNGNDTGAINLVAMIYPLVVLIPGIAVSVRRMHDTGRSGWYMLIPIANLIFSIEEGNKGSNRFGSDPKEELNSA